MYVWRAVIHVKTGCLQELLSLIKEPWEESGWTFYLPVTGPAEVFSVVREFGALAYMDEFSASYVRGLHQFPKDEEQAKFDDLVKSVTSQILAKI